MKLGRSDKTLRYTVVGLTQALGCFHPKLPKLPASSTSVGALKSFAHSKVLPRCGPPEALKPLAIQTHITHRA